MGNPEEGGIEIGEVRFKCRYETRTVPSPTGWGRDQGDVVILGEDWMSSLVVTGEDQGARNDVWSLESRIITDKWCLSKRGVFQRWLWIGSIESLERRRETIVQTE